MHTKWLFLFYFILHGEYFTWSQSSYYLSEWEIFDTSYWILPWKIVAWTATVLAQCRQLFETINNKKQKKNVLEVHSCMKWKIIITTKKKLLASTATFDMDSFKNVRFITSLIPFFLCEAWCEFWNWQKLKMIEI